MMPSPLRSSEVKAKPLAIAARGERIGAGLPSTTRSVRWWRGRPRRAVAPVPFVPNPAVPPGRSLRRDECRDRSDECREHVRCCCALITARRPRCCSRRRRPPRGLRAGRARGPSIAEIKRDLVEFRGRYSPTSRPLRSTVIRSEISYTWSRKCETNRIAAPRVARDCASPGTVRRPRRRRRLEVGSSRISTRADTAMARAMATSCCSGDGVRAQGGARVDAQVEFAASSSSARTVHRAVVDPPEASGLAAQQDVLGHRQIRAEVDLLVHRADTGVLRLPRAGEPAVGAVDGDACRPSISCTPVSALIRVDFPAPFSPISAWISPGSSRRSTPSRALTPGNSTVTPSQALITGRVIDGLRDDRRGGGHPVTCGPAARRLDRLLLIEGLVAG